MGRVLWNKKNQLEKVYRLKLIEPPSQYHPDGYETIVGPYASKGAAQGQAKQRNSRKSEKQAKYIVQESTTVWKDVE